MAASEEISTDSIQEVQIGLLLFDSSENRCLAADNLFLELFNWHKSDLLGLPFDRIFPGREPFQRRTGVVCRCQMSTGQGSTRAVSVEVRTLESVGGDLVYLAVGPEAEPDRAESPERALIREFPGFLLLLDGNGSVQLASRRFEERFGYRDSNLLGRRVTSFFPQRYGDRVEQLLDRLRSSSLDPFDEVPKRITVLQGDGRECVVQISVGRPLGFRRDFLLAHLEDETETARLESELLRERDLLQQVLQTGPSATLVLDTEGVTLYATQQVEAILGFRPEEMLGGAYQDEGWRLSDLDGKLLKPEEMPFAIVRRTGQPIRDRLHRIVGKDGRSVILSVNGSPLPIDTEGRQRYVFSLTDVTEREESRKALGYSEALLRTLFELAPVGIALTEYRTGRYLAVNRALQEFLGYGEEELLSRTLWDVTAEESQAVVREQREKAMEAETFGPYEKSYLHRQGHQVPALVNGRTVTDLQGRQLIWSIVVDIGRRKEREKEVAEHRRRLESILWGTGVGTWEWNVQTGETRFNERWAEIVGYRLEELEPVSIETWKRLAHPDDLQRFGEALTKHFSGEEDFYECEARMRHREGHWVWVLDRGRVISWTEGGEPLWVAGTHLDITEAKRLSEEREELAQRLEHAQRFESLALMAGSMAHQFNNLLTVVLTSLEFAAVEAEGQDQLIEFVDQAVEAAWRAGSLVQQMLLYSGRNQLAFEAFDLGRLLEEQRENLLELVPEGCSFQLQTPTEPLPLRGDPEQIAHALGQLVRNAAEAVETYGSEIAVRATRVRLALKDRVGLHNTQGLGEGDLGLLEVSDSGSGMTGGILKRAFDPFFSTREPGRGLGLSAVLGIARSHNAAVGLQSKVGEGCRVRLYFPLEPS